MSGLGGAPDNVAALVRFAVTVTIFGAAVVGYGWWHARTHATLDVQLVDVANTEHHERVLNAKLAFRDQSGEILALGKTDDRYGAVSLSHPRFGYCDSKLGGERYQECFTTHSRWMVRWIPSIASMDLSVGGCTLRDLPFAQASYRDNYFLWWMPHPHIGGQPYTNYAILARMDGKRCVALPRER